MTAPVFEHVTCCRCFGSGKHSYNQMHGDRCYGCGGKGVVLTKRGQAAQQFLDNLRSRPVDELNVGDLVYIDPPFAKARFLRIEAITPDTLNGGNRWTLEFPSSNMRWGVIYGKGHRMRVGFTAEEKAAQLAAALEYQESLTKSGTVAKRKSAA